MNVVTLKALVSETVIAPEGFEVIDIRDSGSFLMNGLRVPAARQQEIADALASLGHRRLVNYGIDQCLQQHEVVALAEANLCGFSRTVVRVTDAKTLGEVFDRVYEQLRIDNNENAPNSNVWFAPTLDELAEQASPLGGDAIEEVKSGEAEPHLIGDAESATIAWAYECNGQGVYRITESATENEMLEFFAKCMGYEL